MACPSAMAWPAGRTEIVARAKNSALSIVVFLEISMPAKKIDRGRFFFPNKVLDGALFLLRPSACLQSPAPCVRPERSRQSQIALTNDNASANGVCATDAYVRVTVGFDYATTCPVYGVRTGGGARRRSRRPARPAGCFLRGLRAHAGPCLVHDPGALPAGGLLGAGGAR